MPDETLTPEQAQAQIDAIFADRNHPYHRGDDGAVQDVYELTRQSLGERGRAIVAEYGGTTAPADYTPQPVGHQATPPTPAEPPITTPGTFLALAEEVGFAKEEASKLIALEAQQPAGHYTKEAALHGYGPTERSELERLHAKGFARFPLSLQIHLERRGTAFAPGLFSRIAELGGELEALDEQIAVEAARDPGSARLRELVARRHGGQRTLVF